MNEIVKLFNYVQQQVVFVCLSNNIYSVTHHISFAVTEYGQHVSSVVGTVFACTFQTVVLFFISILWTLESVMTGVMAAEPQYNPLTSQGGQTTYNVNLLFCFRYLPRLLQATCH